jgi:hypothetical protein
MPAFEVRDGHVIGTGGAIRIVVDGTTGAIRHLSNTVTGHVMVDGDPAVPWKLSPGGVSYDIVTPGDRRPSFTFHTIKPDGFDADVTDDEVVLRWTTTEPGISVEAKLLFSSGGDLEMWPRVVVDEGVEPPVEITYPVLPGVKQLSEQGTDDVLVFPAHSGWLIRRPLAQMFPVSSPYPDGYSGCSVQFMAYVEQNAGGFYIATHDPHSTWKQFTFGSETSVRHENWDLRAGTSMDLDYPVVIAPLKRGDWFEASERYRAWVVDNAPWCPGAVKRDAEGGRWLRDEVGMSIWCTPSSLDWSRWYRFYAEELGPQPLHIVPGWEWPASRPHTVGKEGWFPANFHPANVQAWDGHYLTPYLNDWYISPAAENFIEEWEPELVMPYRFFVFPVFSSPASGQLQRDYPTTDPRVTTDNPFYLCPSSDKQKDLHAWRDMRLVRDHGMHGSFYDISSGNPLMFSRCLRRDHDHPPGRGRHLIENLEDVNRASKDLVREETGKYLVQGTETIIENIIGSVDFYVSRAVAGPMGFLETQTQGPEEQPGQGRELIPLFQSVYHDIGPVHEDGWIRLIEEEGDLFYWIAARLYVQWGGLMSVHFPITPAERPPGYDGTSEAIGWGGQHQTFEDLKRLDRGKSAFLKELGRARTGFANRYLGHGRMLRAAPFDTGTIDLAFHQKIPGSDAITNAGTWTVPRVIHAAWTDDDAGTIGLVYVNLHADETTSVPLDLDLSALWGPAQVRGAQRAGAPAMRVTAGSSEVVGTVSDAHTLKTDVTLPPRAVVLVEIASGAG